METVSSGNLGWQETVQCESCGARYKINQNDLVKENSDGSSPISVKCMNCNCRIFVTEYSKLPKHIQGIVEWKRRKKNAKPGLYFALLYLIFMLYELSAGTTIPWFSMLIILIFIVTFLVIGPLVE